MSTSAVSESAKALAGAVSRGRLNLDILERNLSLIDSITELSERVEGLDRENSKLQVELEAVQAARNQVVTKLKHLQKRASTVEALQSQVAELSTQLSSIVEEGSWEIKSELILQEVLAYSEDINPQSVLVMDVSIIDTSSKRTVSYRARRHNNGLWEAMVPGKG